MECINGSRNNGPKQLSPESRALRTAWRLACLGATAPVEGAADPRVIDLREYIRRHARRGAL